MSNFINGYILRNSFIHRMNPVLKILMFISIVILVFIPLGLVIQTLIWIIVSIIFFVAKLPKKIYFSNFRSIFIMFLILMFINWFTYKNPGFIIFENKSMLNQDYFLQFGNYSDNFFSKLLNTENFFNEKNFHRFDSDENFLIWKNDEEPKLMNWIEFKELLNNNGIKLENNFVLAIGRYIGSNLIGFKLNLSDKTNFIIPIFEFQGYAISIRALIMTIFIVQKIFIMILIAVILTSTSTSIELSFAIEQFLSPLKLFKLPINALAMTIAIAIRFVPSLLMESQRILNAQASRGIDFKNGSFFERGQALISLIIPMVSIAFRNAAEISNAMEARAYNPRYARTRYRTYRIHFLDWLVYFILMLVLGINIFIVVKNIFFAFFGSLDWMTQGFVQNVIASN